MQIATAKLATSVTQPQPKPAHPKSHQRATPLSKLSTALRKLNPARLSKRERRVFAITSTAGAFNNYDGQLLNLAIGQIQHGLKVAETGIGPMVSLIQLGTVVAPFITAQADRFGRRRLLMFTIVGYTLFTGITALAWSGASFAAFRFGATAFSSAEASIALVMLVEEVASERRGWAVGLLGALSALGVAFAALAYSWIDVIPFGWRGLYIFALLPLAIIIPIRRMLPESAHFEKSAPEWRDQQILGPFEALIHSYPQRFGLVALAMTLTTFGGTAGGLFQAMYLEQAHHWGPSQVSWLVGAGGMLGIIGNLIAGFLSDEIGRRYVGAFFLLIAPILGAVFYNTSGDLMIAAWVIGLFANTAGSTVLNTYSAELFPTSHRGTASSALAVINTLGGVTALLIEPLLYTATHSHWRAASLFYVVALGAPFVVMMFPESACRELDELAPERYKARRRRPIRWRRGDGTAKPRP
jgi:MFS transporter, putative metabolite:H+ symporter